MDIGTLCAEAWATARLPHQALWLDLGSLQQNQFKAMAQAVIDGKEPAEGGGNDGRFERAVAAHLANERAAEAVTEEIVVEEEVEPEKPKKKTTKKAKK